MYRSLIFPYAVWGQAIQVYMKKIIILLKQALQPMLINNAGNIDFMLFATTLDQGWVFDLILFPYTLFTDSQLVNGRRLRLFFFFNRKKKGLLCVIKNFSASIINK